MLSNNLSLKIKKETKISKKGGLIEEGEITEMQIAKILKRTMTKLHNRKQKE